MTGEAVPIAGRTCWLLAPPGSCILLWLHTLGEIWELAHLGLFTTYQLPSVPCPHVHDSVAEQECLQLPGRPPSSFLSSKERTIFSHFCWPCTVLNSVPFCPKLTAWSLHWGTRREEGVCIFHVSPLKGQNIFLESLQPYQSVSHLTYLLIYCLDIAAQS